MASLLSEMERFEQELKDLGADTSVLGQEGVSKARAPLPPPPPPPSRTGAPNLARMPTAVLPPPPPPPRPASAVIFAGPSAASTAPSPASPSASGFFTPQSPPPASPAGNGAFGAQSSASVKGQRPPPPSSPPSVSQGMRSLSSPNVAPPPVQVPTSAGNHMSWLSNGAQTSGSVSKPPPPPATAPQFSYLPASSSYGPTRPSAPPPPSYFPVPFHLQQQQQYLPGQNYQQQGSQGSGSQGPPYQYQSMYQPPLSAPDIYTLPQQQQAQQLFQRDAQTITPEALEVVKAALASGDGEHKSESKKRAIPRKAAGQSWEDPTLSDWPENDHRLFCGDLGNEVNDEVLTKAFTKFASFNMARVVRDKRTGKTKGYGFVSFANPSDLALALKEMNGKYVGNRPIKLRKSTWKERTDVDAVERHKVNHAQNAKRSKTSKKNVLHR